MSFTSEKVMEIEETLLGFIGSECYYPYLFAKLTDGTKYLFDSCGAYWLGDLILSYQNTKVIKSNRMLKNFQIWELDVDLEEQKGVVTCKADSHLPPVIEQDIPYTDFPLREIKLYYVDNVILLPREY